MAVRRKQAHRLEGVHGLALFRCARPSGVPRGPATSTGSLASQRHVVFLELRRHSRVTTGISAFPLGWPWEAQSSPHKLTNEYGLPRWHSGKESACQCRRCKRCEFNPWIGKIPWRRKWQPTSVFLPGESQGRPPPRHDDLPAPHMGTTQRPLGRAPVPTCSTGLLSKL